MRRPPVLRIPLSVKAATRGGSQLDVSDLKQVPPELVEECLEALRKVQTNGQVQLAAQTLHFATGFDLLAWVEDAKLSLQTDEVKQ